MFRAYSSFTTQGTFFIRTLAIATMLQVLLALSACSDAADSSQQQDIRQILQQGQQYLDNSQFKASMKAADIVMTRAPEKEDGYLLMAKTLLTAGQTETALATLDKYQGPPSAEFLFTKVDVLQKSNKLISAQKLLDMNKEILAEDDARWTRFQAEQLLLSKHYEAAEEAFDKLMSNPEYKAEALTGKGKIAFVNKQQDKALDYFTQAHEADPENVQSLMLTSFVYLQQGKLSDAEHNLTLALSTLPASDLFTPERIQILQTLTDTLTRQGRSAEASIYSRLLAEEFPEANSVNQRYLEALDLYKNQRIDQAEQKLRALLEEAPHNRQAATMLGMLLYRKGDLAGAQAYLADIVDPESSNDQLTQLYAVTQLKLAQADRVLSMLDPVIAEESNPNLLYLYTIAAIKQKAWSKAESGLDKLEKNPPEGERLALAKSEYLTRIPSPDLAAAQATLKNALTREPNNPALQKALLENYIQQNQMEQADQFIASLPETSPSVSQLFKGNYFIFRKRYEDARAVFEQLAKNEPDNLDAAFGLAKLQLAEQNWSNALMAFQDYVKAHPDDIRGYQGALLAMIKLGKNLQLASGELPQNHNPAILSLVQTAFAAQQNDLKQAQAYLDKVGDALPHQLIPYKESLDQEITYRRTLSALQYKDYPAARTAALANIQKAPDNKRYLAALINVEIQSKQYDEAEKLIAQMTTQFPGTPLADAFRAELAIKRGDAQLASGLLQSLWREEPSNMLGKKLYLALRNTDEKKASQFLSEWQSAFPASLDAKMNRALELEAGNNNKEALGLYEEILQKAPNHVTTLNNAAWLYHLEKDEKALILAKKAYELAPANPYVLDTYGWILFQSGQASQARSLLEKAKIMLPENQAVQEHWKAVSRE